MRDCIEYLLGNVAHGPDYRKFDARARGAEGAFQAAKQIVDGDNIRGLIDLVRAETEADLLVQADAFLNDDALPAAAVIAGGALETFLRGILDMHAIAWQQRGDRGIATYNNAIAAYRKANPAAPLYTAATSDSISGWAKMRNDAAHEPLTFSEEVPEGTGPADDRRGTPADREHQTVSPDALATGR